jgi:ribonuclease D
MQHRNIDHPVYVDTDDKLKQLSEQWRNCEVLALDTEFIRTDTFFPIGALIQLSDGKGCFLIDPLALNDLSPLRDLLADESIVKVLHSCGEDLEVFDGLLGALPKPLFDTQLACAMDGYGFSVGYQRLTQAMLQVQLGKGETRSNWLQRPLSSSQIHYAALDVAYLPSMYQQLRDSLAAKGRLSWLQEECELMVESYANPEGLEHYYKKVKSAWKLSPLELSILRELTQWRELSARQRDVPRARVLSDKSCFEIARTRPKHLKSLSVIESVTPKMVRGDGEHILNIVKQVLNDVDRESLPESVPRPLPAQTTALLKSLKSHVGHRAEQLQMAPELLARKRDYEALLRSGAYSGEYHLPPSLMGWRKSIIGDQLLSMVVS